MYDNFEDEYNPYYVDDRGNTPLHRAVTNLRKDFHLELSREGNINVLNHCEQTPLHVAVDSWSPKQYFFVSCLLERGADVNAQDIKGQTPLHILVQKTRHYESQLKLCTLLLNKGANVKLQTYYNLNPLRRCKRETALHLAITCDTDFFSLLLESTSGKEAINIPNHDGDTPLVYAVKSNNVYRVKLCLQNGAEVMFKDEYGLTPLHYAYARDSTLDIANESLQSGGDINSVEEDGQAFFFYTCNSDVIDLLAAYIKLSYVVKSLKKTIDLMDCMDSVELNKWAFTQNMGTFLDWGFYPTLNEFSDLLPAVYVYEEIQSRFVIRSTLVNLHNYKTIYIARDYIDQTSYLDSCREEVDRMKLERFGKHSLYDVFGQYDDPTFTCNKDLKSAVESINLKYRFPIYKSLLKATYTKAVKKSLLDAIVDNFPIPIPIEVTRYILTFLDYGSQKAAMEAFSKGRKY